MKFLKRFDAYITESQSKKLKKYFTFSVVMKWYRENQEKIASILGVDVDELASEDELLNQSHGLVNHVINRQSSGNSGSEFRTGFSSFEPLEKNLIHDILHNMYQVQDKEFNKRLDRVEFSESELIEEIEVLGIEESFMKYMNIRYPKTDFINQNINMLVSHLMLAILKNDPQRVADILDEKVEPYVEIYDKQYPVAGTPFEGLYTMFQNTASDEKFDIQSSQDLKAYLVHILNIGEGIDETNGDRASYPDGGFYGSKSFEELDEDEKQKVYDNVISDNRYIDVDETYDVSDLKWNGWYDQFRQYLPLPWDAEEDDWDELEGRIDGVDSEEEAIEFFSEHEGESGRVSLDYRQYLYDQGEDTYALQKYKGDNVLVFNDEGELVTDLDDLAERELIDNSERYEFFHDEDKDFISKEYYMKQDIEDIMDRIIGNDNALAILRRNFRTNDIVKNNTKMGKDNEAEVKGWQRPTGVAIPKGTKGYEYTDFMGEYDYPSLSKTLFTQNALNLMNILNELRGYVIKNVDTIKTQYKENNKRFSKSDVEAFRNLRTLDEKVLDTIQTLYTKNHKYERNHLPSELEEIGKVLRMGQILEKINGLEDIDHVFNWVNKNNIRNVSDLKKTIEVYQAAMKAMRDAQVGEDVKAFLLAHSDEDFELFDKENPLLLAVKSLEELKEVLVQILHQSCAMLKNYEITDVQYDGYWLGSLHRAIVKGSVDDSYLRWAISSFVLDIKR